MIRILLPKSLLNAELPVILEKVHIEFYADERDYQAKLMEDFWDIVYGPEDEKQRSALFVRNEESLFLAMKYIELRNRFDEYHRISGTFDKYIELQGIAIVQVLKDLRKLQLKKPDCFAIVAEKGVHSEAYVDYFAKSYYSQVDENLYVTILDGKRIEIVVSEQLLNNMVNIVIPPLRKRKEDIPYMVDKVLSLIHQRHKKISVQFPDEHTMKLLMSYSWPGNTNELVEVMYKYASGQDIVGHLRNAGAVEDIESARLRDYVNNLVSEIERQLIYNTLQRTSWNRKKTAAVLGLNYKTLCYKMKKYGITRKQTQ